MRVEGSEVTTLITGVVVLFSALAASSNNQIHLTVKSVTKFAIANFPPLFTSSDLGVSILVFEKE